MTDYVVLQKRAVGDGNFVWLEVTSVPAAGKAQAVKSATTGMQGVFKAVPARSWAEAFEVETKEVTLFRSVAEQAPRPPERQPATA